MPGTIQVTLTTPFEPNSARQAMAEDLAHRLQVSVILPDGPLGNIVSDDDIESISPVLQSSSDEAISHFGFSMRGLATGCSTVILDQSNSRPAWGMIIRRRINIFFDEASYPSVFSVDHEIVDGFGDYSIEPDILIAETVLIEMIADCYTEWCFRAQGLFGRIKIAPIQHHVLGNSFSGGKPLMMMAQAIGAALSNHETGIRQIGPFLCAAGFKSWQRPASGASDAASLRLRALGASTTFPMEWNSRSTKFGASTPEVTTANDDFECRSLVEPDEFAEIAIKTEWAYGHPASRIPLASDNRFNINVSGDDVEYVEAIYSVRHDISFDTTGPLDLVKLTIAVDHEWGDVRDGDVAQYMAEELGLFVLETCRNVINRPGSVRKHLEIDVSFGSFLGEFGVPVITDIVKQLRSYSKAVAPEWFEIRGACHIIVPGANGAPIFEPAVIFNPLSSPVPIKPDFAEALLDHLDPEFEQVYIVDLVMSGSADQLTTLIDPDDLEGAMTRWPFLLAMGTTDDGDVEPLLVSSVTGELMSILPDARRIGPLPHMGDIGGALLHAMQIAGTGIVFKGKRPKPRPNGMEAFKRIICESFRVKDAAVVPYSMLFAEIPGAPPLVKLLIGSELTGDEWMNAVEIVDPESEHFRDDGYPVIVVPDNLDCGFGEGDVLTTLTTFLSRMAVTHVGEDDPKDVIPVVRFVAQRLALKLGAKFPGGSTPGPALYETDIYFAGMKEPLEAFADGELSMRMPAGRKIRLYEAAAMIAAIADDINEDLSRRPPE